MTAQSVAVFDTPVGPCAIAWGEAAITGVALPEGDATRTRTRLLRRLPDAREALPPPDVQKVIDAIVSLLHGELIDLSWVALDMDRVPAFDRRVYEIARTIPAGATRTYGQIAQALSFEFNPSPERAGWPPKAAGWGLAREVGQALGRNPFPIIVPCHRVLAAGGKAGGFSARGGIATKLRLLSIERARTSDALSLFDTGPALGFAVKSSARRS
jgi:methylated-DNA-[protein]-cysteine S-methyltransferase